jgi:hypothetical protein
MCESILWKLQVLQVSFSETRDFSYLRIHDNKLDIIAPVESLPPFSHFVDHDRRSIRRSDLDIDILLLKLLHNPFHRGARSTSIVQHHVFFPLPGRKHIDDMRSVNGEGQGRCFQPFNVSGNDIRIAEYRHVLVWLRREVPRTKHIAEHVGRTLEPSVKERRSQLVGLYSGRITNAIAMAVGRDKKGQPRRLKSRKIKVWHVAIPAHAVRPGANNALNIEPTSKEP